MFALVSLLLLGQAASGVGPVVQAPKATIDEFLGLVRQKDAAGLDRSAGYAFYEAEPGVPRAGNSDVTPPATFFKQIVGCSLSAVSYKYSQVVWACKGRPAPSPALDAKYAKCFDTSRVATLRETTGRGVIILLRDGAEWSTERCGKRPIFVPPPVPSTASKK